MRTENLCENAYATLSHTSTVTNALNVLYRCGYVVGREEGRGTRGSVDDRQSALNHVDDVWKHLHNHFGERAFERL